MSRPTRLTILGAGARTPIGLNAPSSAAARRAAISGFRKHPFLVDGVGDPVIGALDTQLDPRLFGASRFVELAEPAIREACYAVGPVAAKSTRVPVFLGLPEFRPGFTEAHAETIRQAIENLNGLPFHLVEVHCFPQGHASGLIAPAAAATRLRAHDVEYCLVGGVDSYFHPETLEWLDTNRQLQGKVSRSSFVPGEGAGFLLVGTAAAGANIRMPALATITEPALGRETKLIKTAEVCVGAGLTSVILEALQSLGPQADAIGNVICDINGERYRSEEWGFVTLRVSRYFKDATSYWAPADCWGDMGAASAPLFAMLACQSARRGYAEGPLCMIWMSSESGPRAAAILELPIE